MPRFAITRDKQPTGSEGKLLRIFSKGVTVPAVNPKTSTMQGKTVWLDDGEAAGVVVSDLGDCCLVRLAVPTDKGLLALSGTTLTIKKSELKEDSLVVGDTTVKSWNLLEEFESKSTEVKDGNRVTDYLDVFVEGLASTFAKTTPADRDGDYVMDNAFDGTLGEFKKNPVMLIDHRNSVMNIAGSFDKIGIVDKGLAVRGRVSNAPDLARVRFLIMEKHLKAFSMGGMFFYGTDGRAIQKVDLFEVSLVAIPANQDALFSVRSPTLEEAKKMFKNTKQLSNKKP